MPTVSVRLVLAALVLFGACESAPVPERSSAPILMTEFQPTEVAGPVPVRVEDGSGLVVAVEPARAPGRQRNAVQKVPGRPTAVGVIWRGGPCDRVVRVTLGPLHDRMEIRITTDRGDSCRSGAILRGLVIEFRIPIAPGRVDLTTDVP